jgi:hypothetical protein
MYVGWDVDCRNMNGMNKEVKVKVTLIQALRLCTGRTAHRGSRGIALPFLDHGTRRGWGVSVTTRPLFTPGKDPVPIVQEAGWVPKPVWKGAENLAPTGIGSPDRTARSQSRYRLSYPEFRHVSFTITHLQCSKATQHRHTSSRTNCLLVCVLMYARKVECGRSDQQWSVTSEETPMLRCKQSKLAAATEARLTHLRRYASHIITFALTQLSS